MTARQKFQQRTFRLVGRQQVDGLLALVRNLPIAKVSGAGTASAGLTG